METAPKPQEPAGSENRRCWVDNPMNSMPGGPSLHKNLVLSEIVGVALDTFRLNKIRFTLTALGMVIGTASLILVVTVGLTGKQYVLNQIQGIGANMIYAFHEGQGDANPTAQDSLTVADMHAVEQQVAGVVAVSPMVQLHARIPAGNGREQEVLILGVGPQYDNIRNLDVLAGRFFDEVDSQSHSKVAALTQHLAQQMFGSQDAAIGQTIKIMGLPFTVIGTFKERVETFGQSELAGDTIAIPYTVARYFLPNDALDQIFFSMADLNEVPAATKQIQAVLQSRHRAESVYRVENLAQLITVAGKSANALSVVLLLISAVTLLVGGVGIMNIMLATVTSRTHEIGIRRAVGATAADIRLQFLSEAVLISIAGGVIGSLLGLALPVSIHFLTDYRIPISGLSAVIGIFVSSLVGIIFGTVPATRAAQLDPIESLRHE
ncbi:MAG: ABC transporter permease [Terriglobales bacterium]